MQMIAVLTSLPKDDYSDSMGVVKSEYCALYGYKFITSSKSYYPGRNASWNKVGMVMDNLRDFDWVAYLSPDVGFANFSLCIEKLVNEQSKRHDIILARDAYDSVDTDVMLFRNSRKAWSFLKEWGCDGTYKRWPGGERRERWAFWQLSMGEFSDAVSMVSPMRVMNARAIAVDDYFRKQYHEGDFILNCICLDEHGRKSEADRILLNNRPYIAHSKEVVKFDLKDGYLREVHRIARKDMIFNKPKELAAPKTENVAIVARDDTSEVAMDSYDSVVQSARYLDGVGSDTDKIEIRNANETITIWRNSRPAGEKNEKDCFVRDNHVDDKKDAPPKNDRRGAWGFTYPKN